MKKIEKYTPEDLALMRDLYTRHTAIEVAQMMGRTVGGIKSALRKYKIKLTANEMYNKHRIIQSRIVCHSRWGKGNLPWTTIYDRKVSVRSSKGWKLYYIKKAHGVWVELHKELWRKVYGEILPKHVLRFKDGNTLNPEINNLELVPMGLNMLLNSRHKYDRCRAETQYLICELNKAIKDAKHT
jgi:hypothetical protein